MPVASLSGRAVAALLAGALVVVPTASGRLAARALPQRFVGDGNGVVVDVVVRDGRGRLVTDLTLADLELLEDGVPQRLGLLELVGETGRDSPDGLAVGVPRSDTDRPSRYRLTYQPTRIELDGAWRSIAVRVKRPDVTIQAGQGYVAVRSPDGLPVPVYEGPALAALDRTPRPRDIATRVGAFAFPRARPPASGEPFVDDVAIVVAAQADQLTSDVKGSGSRTDYTMLALVRDADGRVIHKTSQPYRLPGSATDRKTIGGGVRFARTLPLPAGSYRAWGAVHDGGSGRAGVADWPLEVADRGPTGLGVSSLVIVGRSERIAGAAAAPRDPLIVGDMVLTPNLGEFLYRTPDARLGLYFTVVGAEPGDGCARDCSSSPTGFRIRGLCSSKCR
jgi:hypothetical protein